MTCDAHFRTWMSYSSQKSCVKIWFGLIEIGGMWIFRGCKSSLLGWGGGEVTCDLRCPSSNLAELLQSKFMCENQSGLVEPFKSYHVHKQTYKHPPTQKKKKKKKFTDATENAILGKLFSPWIIVIAVITTTVAITTHCSVYHFISSASEPNIEPCYCNYTVK